MNYKNLKIKSFRDNIIAGKTLFCMNLALWFASIGKKTLYVSLADQSIRDCLVRLGSIAFGITFKESNENIQEVYNNLVKITGSNLDISINSAGTISVDQVINLTMTGGYKCLFLDYDGVLKVEGKSADENSYNAFGDIYNALTVLPRNNILTVVATQPKVSSYSQGGIITMADLSESSKKCQVADCIVTISRISSNDSSLALFDARFVKNRRGSLTKTTLIRNQARFIEIPRGLAEQLKMETEEVSYTDQQIQAMAERFKQQEQNIKQAIKQEQKQRHDNPFT